MFWQEYKSLTAKPDCPAQVWVYLACALFFLGLYKEAEEAALKGICFSLALCTILRFTQMYLYDPCLYQYDIYFAKTLHIVLVWWALLKVTMHQR